MGLQMCKQAPADVHEEEVDIVTQPPVARLDVPDSEAWVPVELLAFKVICGGFDGPQSLELAAAPQKGTPEKVPTAKELGVPPAPPQHVRNGRPDFTGVWLMTGYEGDMDAMMQALELGWMVRSAAASMDYGKGRLEQNITHAGSDFALKTQHSDTRFEIGGAAVPHAKLGGQMRAEWDADAIRVEIRGADGSLTMVNYRYLTGVDKMSFTVVIAKSDPMVTVVQHFVRKE